MSDNIYWPNYLFFTDFSNDAEQLIKVPTGVLSASDATLLVAALSTHDTGPCRALWNAEEGQAYSLAGANVLFNDKNHTNLPTNGRYGYALVLQLPWGDAPYNLLALNYNYGPTTAPAA